MAGGQAMKDRQRNELQEACLLRFHETGDQEALQFLVDSMERLVKQQVGRALKWSGKRVSNEDLMSVGRLSIIHAANTHDPTRGVPFRLYASMFIHGDVYEYAMRNSMDVSFSNSRKERKIQREIFGFVADAEASGMTRSQAVITASKYYNITEDHAADAMQIRYSKPVDLGDVEEASGDETSIRPACSALPIEEKISRSKSAEIIADLLSQLDDEERDIVVSYRYAEPTQSLDAIAARHGCSRDRVKRIEVQAMRWLALTMKERGLTIEDLL
jgi:RNA polymerase sigma-32 factor